MCYWVVWNVSCCNRKSFPLVSGPYSDFWAYSLRQHAVCLTWFLSCLMECCSVKMWLNSGLCSVSRRFPTASLWLHSSLCTSLAWSRSRAPRTCWRSPDDTEKRDRIRSRHRDRTHRDMWRSSKRLTCGDIFIHGCPLMSVCGSEHRRRLHMRTTNSSDQTGSVQRSCSLSYQSYVRAFILKLLQNRRRTTGQTLLPW